MKNCILCGSSNFIPAYRDMYRCQECKLFIKKNPPSKKEIKNQLKNFLLSACHSEKTFQKRMKNAERQVEHLHSIVSPGKLYDVGAAGGFFMEKARSMGWEVRGNDVSAAAIDYAKRKFNLQIDYEFFEDVVLEEDAYDAVVMWNTLEHTHDPAETINHAKKSLKPGGVLFIKVPEMPTIPLLKKYYEPYHFYEFNYKNLSNFLTQSGFEEFKINKLWKSNEISATEYLFVKKGDE